MNAGKQKSSIQYRPIRFEENEPASRLWRWLAVADRASRFALSAANRRYAIGRSRLEAVLAAVADDGLLVTRNILSSVGLTATRAIPNFHPVRIGNPSIGIRRM